MPRTDRWSPDNSRGHYGPRHGTWDHTRSSWGHSIRHDRSRGRSAVGENRRGQRGRSRERSTLTRVHPSRRPNPSEIQDRFIRREQTTFLHSSRRGATPIRQSDTSHTPGHSTEPENKTKQSHSHSQNTLNASKTLRTVRARVVQTHPLPMYRPF